MINYLKRSQIDLKKYDACIEKSKQSRVYAYSWYLDIVADNWGVLVQNDYEIVMPLPWRTKYFIPYIYVPYFIQQLGLFSKKETSEEDMLLFLDKIPKIFLKRTLSLNSENNVKNTKHEVRMNYILPLICCNNSFIKNFSKGRKHAISVAQKNKLILTEICHIEDLIDISKKYYSFFPFSKKEYYTLDKLTETLKNKEKGFVKIVKSIDDEILGGAIFLKDNNRITYLFAVYTNEGKKLQAPSFLIHEMIKKYSDSNLIFDFEGSMIPSIASFFKSFGAVKEPYFSLKNDTTIF